MHSSRQRRIQKTVSPLPPPFLDGQDGSVRFRERRSLVPPRSLDRRDPYFLVPSFHLENRAPVLISFVLRKADSADLFPTISHCTDLRSLNFIFAGIGTFAWIPLVISQISSPHVEEIDLGITDIFAPDDFDRFDWPSLWSALTQTRFVKLRSVRFMVAAESCQSSKMKERITHHLRKIDTRGLIYVECPT